MQYFSGFVHRIVRQSRGEELVIALRRHASHVRKFIPLRLRHRFFSFGRLVPNPADYSRNDAYALTRDDTNFVINRSDYVQWRLFYGVRDHALRLAKECLTHDAVVLDIGSNFGAFSLKLARFAKDHGFMGIQVHAFEPNPEVAALFLSNLDLNADLRSHVTLHPVGLGKENGEQDFSVPANNTGAARIGQAVSGERKRVQIRRLDELANEIDFRRVSFIKLIAEGFEPQILDGAWKLITAHTPPIFMEVTPTWWLEHGYQVDAVLDRLRKIGYRFMTEQHNEMLPFEQGHPDRTQYNIFAFRG